MATLQIEPDFPQITSAQGLALRRLELCVELHGEGTARIFARARGMRGLETQVAFSTPWAPPHTCWLLPSLLTTDS